jgi:hypothetical protein
MQPEGIAQALQIISFHERPSRLCRPDARKASGFPTRPPTSALFPAGWKAEPSSLWEEVPWDTVPTKRRSLFRRLTDGAARRHRPGRRQFGQARQNQAP